MPAPVATDIYKSGLRSTVEMMWPLYVGGRIEASQQQILARVAESEAAKQQVSQQLDPKQWFEVSFEQQVNPEALERLTAVAELQISDPDKIQLTLHKGYSVSQLLQQLTSVAELADFSRIQPSLHQLYLTAVQRHNQQKPATQQPNAEGDAA